MRVYRFSEDQVSKNSLDRLKRYELKWLIYFYQRCGRTEGVGVCFGWNGNTVYWQDMSHCRRSGPFTWFHKSTKLTADDFLAYVPMWKFDGKMEKDTDHDIVRFAQQLLLIERSGLNAPKSIVADWYEDKGEMAYAEILRLDESGMSEVREASEICFSDRPQSV